MRDIHPTATAGDGRPVLDRKRRGKNEESETNFIPCPHCGFFYDKRRDSRPDGQEGGLAQVSVQVSLQSGGTKTITESQRQSGCPLCGHDAERSTYREPFYNTVNLQGR